ncbi:hypothetical protein [Desulfogranum mediterraneum]|uniref:hypothetical protein n=1 Tax=Desulfogranum mediterraneum TaxID=160661 RepID=UPI00041BE0B1|nr:hypothetical protein [Desulfogranum mediterraneum]
MKSLFDVPFLPEASYVDFLRDNVDELDSVHFSLLPGARLDSRILQAEQAERSENLAQLARLQGPRKYALMNSRFYLPPLLTDTENIRPIIDTLEEALCLGVIDGIIYCDHYLLQRLSDEAPDIASSLEAVPGVNTMLDCFGKIESQLYYIRETRFQQPRKIILDRSLNRDLDMLAKVALQCHTQFPELRLEVLANEGCLPYCPFKLSHDSYIALANISQQDTTYQLNCNLGCVRLLNEQPHRLLLSPFIRPEDIDLYFYHIDTIKLCGRSLGGGFLRNVFQGYLDRRYEGNLLDLLDAVNWLARSLYIENSSLSFDFANMLSMCDYRCDQCGFCKDLFEAVSHRLPAAIPDHRALAD